MPLARKDVSAYLPIKMKVKKLCGRYYKTSLRTTGGKKVEWNEESNNRIFSLFAHKSRSERKKSTYPDFLAQETCKKAFAFHQTCAGYAPTPLVSLPDLAKELGVAKIFVKDESHRFGLQAFKVLGASYAIANLICEKLGMHIQDVTFATLQSAEAREKTGSITFATATDGNHGRAVAWAARQLGQHAVVYLPKGSAEQRVKAITETGAEAVVTDLNYDETVQLVRSLAEENGWQVVQDTAWEGYTQIPKWIMQGYTTMVMEAEEQLFAAGVDKPTHLFLQAGVGSMAGSVLGYFANRWQNDHPVTAIVEPHRAACVYESVSRGDGKAHAVSGDLATIMAGLSCGEPNPIAWETLRDFADLYVRCDDSLSAMGMRVLANPLGSDPKIISGESGAVGLGVLAALQMDDRYRKVRSSLGVNENSVILLFNTEGDTDPVNYREIVWNGKYPY